jgi:hypothetical protein
MNVETRPTLINYAKASLVEEGSGVQECDATGDAGRLADR